MFHGRATLIGRALEHPRWASGVFFAEARFNHAAYVDAYGDDMLNAAARVLSLGEIRDWDSPPETKLFVRPNDDSKRFPGQVTN